MRAIVIPKNLTKDDLVLVPRAEYEKLIKSHQQTEWEKKDTDEAIKIFKEEKKKNKLLNVRSLSEID